MPILGQMLTDDTSIRKGRKRDKQVERSVWYVLWIWLMVVPVVWLLKMLRLLSDYRWEVAPVLVGVIVVQAMVEIFGDSHLVNGLGLILGTAAAYPLIVRWWNKRAIAEHNAHRAMLKFRRNWPDHTQALDLYREDSKGRPVSPRIKHAEDFGGGSCRLDLQLPRGMITRDVEAKDEALAAAYHASSAQVDANTQNASQCHITFIGRDDPLYQSSRGAEIFHEMEPGISPDTPIPVGYTSTGEIEYVTLKNNNFLIGGAPGGGKSVGVRPFLAMGAMMEHTQLWLADPKRVEFGPWAAVATRIALDQYEAVVMFEDFIGEMMNRYDYMIARGINYLPPSAEWPRLLLVVDEVAELTTPLSKEKEDKDRVAVIQNQLGRIVALGRAASCVPIICTQKPDASTIDTRTRDNIAIRLCFRCGNEHQAGTILGDDAVRNGATPHLIAKAHAGLGYMTSETGGKAKRFRSFFIDHDTDNLPASDVLAIVEKVTSARGTTPVSAPTSNREL